MAGKFNPKGGKRSGIDQHIDLSVYDSTRRQQIPGKYRVSVFVNEEKMASRTLDFSTASEAKRKASGESVYALFLARGNWKKWACALTASGAEDVTTRSRVAFDEIIPRATSRFDFNTRRCIFPSTGGNDDDRSRHG